MRRRAAGYTVRRTLLTGAAIAGLIAAVAGTTAAVQGEVEPGVVVDAEGRTVASVSRDGFAWRDGIRAGQAIESLHPADSPGGWEIRTTDGTQEFRSRATPFEQALRASLPLGLAAIGAAVLGLLLLRTRRDWVLPAASAAFLASSVPLGMGGPEVSTLGLAGALAIPGFGLAAQVRAPVVWRVLPCMALIAFLAVWATSKANAWETYEGFEDVRGLASVAAFALLLGSRVILPSLGGDPVSLTRPRLLDALLAAIATGAVVAGIYVVHLSPVLVGAAGMIGVLLLAPVRRVSRPFRNAVLGDLRAEAVAEGAELERARLARELHDVPLQELIGVIRRLEIRPGTEAESDDLRALAGHLREVASDLRPPVLDDFGLPAALAQIAEETTTRSMPVTSEVEDETGMNASQRPPSDVELAMYRIAHQAVANAIAHSGASAVAISARVTPSAVHVEVRDDGSGLDPTRAGKARREKHLGLASMRRRAQAIDAEFSIEAEPGRGTAIRAVWRR